MSEREQLPIDGYDQMPVDMLRDAIRPLGEHDLQVLLDYERAHADRPQVEEILTSRMAELEAGAQPTSGRPPSGHPRPEDERGQQDVGPQKQADRMVPPSHGDPANRERPRLGPHG
ncbi:hypothetical protein EF847_19535 [Actinobacteria bacterium YIM 96077]|uniref:DUF8129 domain-containing protein n=1 Tax=Phytoactinopolyspora halophila TaxID=1981511 RepID=A0A329QP86_9ACTN|nr:hypothetical protein [Phytoactinopolyspora halophila]AYY15680.1 hypothetical protein EF847_19535 [Actinobacteria bacterium YIM 96077]RAW14063.1 hypothetical protein DPM12_11600 [Phytoactinopolyspora halophila]